MKIKYGLRLIFLTLLALFLQATPSAGAYDALAKRTPFYDPDVVVNTCSSSTNLVGSENAEKIYHFFISQGMQPFQAAGIMGNMQAEAHFETRLVEYGYKNSRGEVSVAGKPSSLDDNVPPDQPNLQDGKDKGQPGYGLIQWTKGRKQPLRDASASGTPLASDLGLQLNNIMTELNGPYKKAAYDPLLASKDVDEATSVILDNYEIPGNKPVQRPIRQGFARDILAKFGSSTEASSSTPASSSSAAPTTSGCVSTGVGEYQNPLRDIKNLRPGRIDQGVDYGGDGPVYAIGNGTVTIARISGTGWPGPDGGSGSYVGYLLSDGPAAGKTIYVAENCTLKVKKGDSVNANTELCEMHNAWPNIETGWSEPAASQTLAHSVYSEGDATAYGVNFDALMQKLGAPAGHYENPAQRSAPVGSLPSDWPNW